MHSLAEAPTTFALWGTAAGILVLLLVSAVMSGAETALTTASRGKLHGLAERGTPGAEAALAVTEDKERLIGAILLGSNLANILAASLATSAPDRALRRRRRRHRDRADDRARPRLRRRAAEDLGDHQPRGGGSPPCPAARVLRRADPAGHRRRPRLRARAAAALRRRGRSEGAPAVRTARDRRDDRACTMPTAWSRPRSATSSSAPSTSTNGRSRR